jgi:predicted amidohydrolase
VKVDIAIRNGKVVDPAAHRKGFGDIYIQNGKIVAGGADVQADYEIDAAGQLVLPGLIDYHLHVFPQGTDIGIDADSSLLPQGVTTAVDAGSAGTSNFAAFRELVAERSTTRIKAFINVCPAGLATSQYHENVDPKYWNRAGIRKILEQYPELVQGIKIRISRAIVQELGMKPLEEAVKLAAEAGTRLAVHSTDPTGTMADIASCLRAGDILVHCFHGTGHTLVDGEGKIHEPIWQARRRGVVMDAANGRNHWAFAVAEAALAQGFAPDIISTDLTGRTLFRDPVFGLPYLMSKYLMLGMSLPDVVAACTAKPAELLGMTGVIGTLAPGAVADVSVFSLSERAVDFADTQGVVKQGKVLLSPRLTLRGGKIVFRSL